MFGYNNNCGCDWIIILIILYFLFCGCGNNGSLANNCGNTCCN